MNIHTENNLLCMVVHDNGAPHHGDLIDNDGDDGPSPVIVVTV